MDGMAATNIPKKPYPAPNHSKNLIFMDHQKKEPPNSTVPKVAETTPPVALTRTLLSQGGGGGTKKPPRHRLSGHRSDIVQPGKGGGGGIKSRIGNTRP